MSIKVVVPKSLKHWLDGKEEVDCEGKNVAECIEYVEKRIPGFKQRIVDEKGELREDVFVFVNGDNIRHTEGLATQVSDNDQIGIIPLVL